MKKRLLTLLLISTMAVSLYACGGSDSSENASKAKTQTEETEKSDDSSNESSTKDLEESETTTDEKDSDFVPIGDSLAIDFALTGPTDFPKDTTGRWYKAMFAESKVEFQYYALDYYQEYFHSNDEVHVVYNFSNNTVNCITCPANYLSVRILDYVKKEEHDASAACGGTQLAEYHIDIETGTIEKIQ